MRKHVKRNLRSVDFSQQINEEMRNITRTFHLCHFSRSSSEFLSRKVKLITTSLKNQKYLPPIRHFCKSTKKSTHLSFVKFANYFHLSITCRYLFVYVLRVEDQTDCWKWNSLNVDDVVGYKKNETLEYPVMVTVSRKKTYRQKHIVPNVLIILVVGT